MAYKVEKSYKHTWQNVSEKKYEKDVFDML